MQIRDWRSAAALLASCAGVAFGGGPVEAARDLMREFPGVRAYRDGVRERAFYGRPMTTAPTARQAADRWLAEHGDAFGVGGLDLVTEWSGPIAGGRFEVFLYTQRAGGLAVDSSPGRVLARANGDGSWSVVYGAGLFAAMPEGGFAPMTRTAQDAVNFVRGSEFGRLPAWSAPTLVAWQRETATGFEAVRAWKLVGENPDLVKREKYTFFVDAATGALLEARDEVHNIDVFGTVKGYATPGVLPDKSGNAPVLTPINDLRVVVSGGNNAYTDTAGVFTIAHGGSSDVGISANLDFGQWCNINDQSGTGVQSVSGTATPGSEAYLEFNSAPSQYLTAQVNGFIHTGLIHNFFTDRSGWAGMDFRCTTNVNIASTCNAYFDGSSINFYRAGGGCNNTGYSTVVAHEYGHYVVARLNLSQGSFGEGYGDCCAELLYDTGIVGEDFFTSGGDIRDNDNEIVTYPCGVEIHFCGQVLGGVWWHARENMGTTYGSAQGLAETQQLFVDWSLITTGGSGNNGAHPGTAIEVLTIDDNDGNLSNGTPNYDDLCAAFGQHAIDCPEIDALIFAYPNGLPELLTPGQDTDIDLTITANGVNPLPATAEVWYWVDGAGLTSGTMVYNGGDAYTATIAGVDCTSEVTYFFQVDGDDGNTYADPRNGTYAASAFDDILVPFEDNFQTNKGWSVSGNATSGQWQRGVPVNGGRGDPASDYDGSGQCYVTQNVAGDTDVDNGSTILTSPFMDATGGGTLSYAYWLNDIPGGEIGVEDGLLVEIATNAAGNNWATVHDYGTASSSWRTDTVTIPDTATLRVRFTASDNTPGDVIEAGVDAVELVIGVCDDCVADFNNDGTVNTVDVLAFLNAWNAGDSSADINGDGTINTQDVLMFLNLWNIGCE